MQLLVSLMVSSGTQTLIFLLYHLQCMASTSCPKVATGALAIIFALQETGRKKSQRRASSPSPLPYFPLHSFSETFAKCNTLYSIVILL